jgi:hypothetical protein
VSYLVYKGFKMKTWMISIFSIAMVTLSLTGCGEEGSMHSVSSGSVVEIETQQVLTPIGSAENGMNEYGISSELGTPPELPFS